MSRESLHSEASGEPSVAPLEVVRAEGSSRAQRVRRGLRRHARWLLPLGLLLAAPLAWLLLFATKQPPPVREAPSLVPAVRVVIAQPVTRQLSVVAHGTVVPRTESDLVAEVRGRVVEVSPALEAGGFFEAGDELLRLDGREYEIALERARAAVKLARSEARLAASEVTRRRELSKRGIASASDLEQFENRAAVADATLDQARASLAQAELDLERTVVSAPFDGRARERLVDVGQFVSPGTTLARIFAVDYAEVVLPIRTEDLFYIDVPLGFLQGEAAGLDAPVRLSARLGGRELEWPARLVRTEGEIDPRTRMLNLVARVDDPYARKDEGRMPLPAGLFVEAEIGGRSVDQVYVLPGTALRDGNRVFVVDDEDRLAFRDVEVVRRNQNEALIGAGLSPGDRVIVSPLRAVSEGMRVEARPEDAP